MFFVSFCMSRLVALNRACDYVRLIGVLARENAFFIAAHVREQYGMGANDRT